MANSSLPVQNRWSPGEGLDAAELHVLIADDSSQHTEELVNALRTAGYAVRPRFVQDRAEWDEAIAGRSFDVILVHPLVSDLDVAAMSATAQAAGQDAPMLVIADRASAEMLDEAFGAGAVDVVRRADKAHLLAVVRRELDRLSVQRLYRTMERRALEAERRCMTLLDSSRDAVAFVHEGMHVYANAAYLQLFGYGEDEPEEIAGLPLLDLVADDDAAALRSAMRQMSGCEQAPAMTLGELTAVRSDGGRTALAMQLASAVYDGERCMLVTAHDLSERKQFERQLHHMRRRDPATGLFNNAHMREQLQRLGKAAVAGVSSGFILAEIDGFDAIRRTVGISLTNDIIRDVAATLSGQLGERALLARMTEQTFGIALPRRDEAGTRTVAEQIRLAVETHLWDHAEHSVATTCSVGAVVLDAKTPDAAQALARADEAVNEASRAGGNRVVVAERNVDVDAAAVLTPASTGLTFAHVCEAIANSRARVLYQPIVHLAGDAAEIYEASIGVRDVAAQARDTDAVWRALDAADDPGEAELWLLRTALDTVGPLNGQGRGLRLFMRLSVATLRNRETLSELGRTVVAAGLAPGTVTFELPTSAARQHVKGAKFAAHGLRAAACRVALRGFGQDRRDFALLTHVDADYLMLAPELLDGLSGDAAAQQRLAEVQHLAQQAGKATIATAVSDPHALSVLWQCGVPYAHGHYIQEPSGELTYDFVDT